MLKSLLIGGIAVAMAFGSQVDSSRMHPLSDEMVEYINKMNTSWKAGRNFDKSIPMSYIRGLMGVLEESKESRLAERIHEIPEGLPDTFDARQKWANCKSIDLVRDQSACGSCWAFGAVEAMSDRVCIHSNGRVQVDISAEDLMDCCDKCGSGCSGGVSAAAWQYWKDAGLVSGGLYNTTDGCKPYSLAPCEHSSQGSLPECVGTLPTPKCKRQCREGYERSYDDDKYFAKNVYSINGSEKQIRTEIFRNGPVEAEFTAYADFLSYKSGVYQHHSRDIIGRHAIRILGWGSEDNNPYWLLANSWNEDWGDHGYFKMLRGVNECDIESFVNAGIPKLH
ncbi:cathepsin B-like [Ixodes scapularis]